MLMPRKSAKRQTRKISDARPLVERLEERSLLSGIVVGSGLGQVGRVSIVNESGAVVQTIEPFGNRYRGGVNVAQGDVNGDGIADVIAAMDRGNGTVRVFDGATYALLKELQPFGPRYRGGANVAFGQFAAGSGGGIVVSSAHGRAPVNLYDAATWNLVQSINAYGRGVRGVEVAAANLNGGFASEIVTAPAAGRGAVAVFDPATGAQIATLEASDRRHHGTTQLATGDFDNNGLPDLVTAVSQGRSALVTVWSSMPGNPIVSRFVASAPGAGPVEVGVNQTAGPEADSIAVTRAASRPGVGKPINLFDESGDALGTQTADGLGGGLNNLASAATVVHTTSALANHFYGANYSPTWPYWGPGVPQDLVGSATSNTITAADPGTNWYTNVYANQQVYVFPTSNPGGGTIYPIASNTANTLTIQGSFAQVPNNSYTFKILTGQLQDSDFFNSAFQGLWGTDPKTGKGRDDLGTMASTGFDLIRLYNWGPTRGNENNNPPQPPQTDFQAHTSFLNTAYYGLHMQVMVPVSNFFLSNAPFAWLDGNGNPVDPDSSLSFSSAPQAIQSDLTYFLKSITQLASDPNNPTGHDRINPAVQSIAVGNEIDLNLQFGAKPQPDATSKLLRVQWWLKNLHDQILATFPNDTSHPLLTTVISNADQGDTPGLSQDQQQSWFQVFVNGTDLTKKLPNGTVNGAAGVTPQQTFRLNVPGLASGDTASWYKDWYFNSMNIFQLAPGLTQVLTQYDNGTPGGTWSQSWPGAKLDVPMMFTELGLDRLYQDPPAPAPAWSEGKIADTIADQLQAVVSYIQANPNTEALGFTFFEFNDEPNKNGSTDPTVFHDAVYGMYKYYTSTNVNDFRNGTVQYTLQTGTTPSLYETYPLANYVYPVYALNPVITTDGTPLKDKIKGVITKS
jgi:hypothetical protein